MQRTASHTIGGISVITFPTDVEEIDISQPSTPSFSTSSTLSTPFATSRRLPNKRSIFSLAFSPKSRQSLADCGSQASFHLDVVSTRDAGNCGTKCKSNYEVEDYTKSPIYEAFYPLLTSLKIGGLYYNTNAEDRNSLRQRSLRMYCLNGAVVAWASVIFMLALLRNVDKVDQLLMNILSAVAWTSLSALNATAGLRASHQPKQQRKFCRGFGKLQQFGGPYVQLEGARATARHVTVAIWVVLAIKMVSFGYATFLTTLFDPIFETFVPQSNVTGTLIIKIVFLCQVTLLEMQFNLLNGLEFAFTIVLFKELGAFRKTLADAIDDEGCYHGNLETARCHFVELARLVKAADRCLAIHHGASFACNTANICLLLYAIIFFPAQYQTPPFIFWFITCLADIIGICVCGIVIFIKLSKIKDRLHRVSVNGKATDFSIKLIIFLNQFDDNLGFTVARLFVIDQTVIMTLLGMFVTYFLVVLQFSSMANTSGNSGYTNCTEFPSNLSTTPSVFDS